MSKLKEKPSERLSNSRLSHPIIESPITFGNYMTRDRCAPFWSARGLGYDSSEWTSANNTITGVEHGYPGTDGGAPLSAVGASRYGNWSVTLRLAPYIAAGFILSAGLLLVAAASHDSRAAPEPVHSDQAGVATVFSIETGDTSQSELASATPSLMANGERWPDTVETFKRLLAEQKAAQEPTIRQAENERILGQMEAWLKAKSR